MGLVKLYKKEGLGTCKCGNWRIHFNNYFTQWIIWCSEITCERIAILGTPVQLLDKKSLEIFIVPLCNFHADSTKAIDIGNVKPINIFMHECHEKLID